MRPGALCTWTVAPLKATTWIRAPCRADWPGQENPVQVCGPLR